MLLSKNKIKYIRSLEQRKGRKAEKTFLAEGPKLIEELLPHFNCRLLIGTSEWLSNNQNINAEEIIETTQEEINRGSLLKSPQQVMAVFEQPQYILNKQVIEQSLTLMLDDIQDPGNLGTIIRLADWFGIENIICSLNSADVYNPKVIQATMGGISRVKVHYCDLPGLLSQLDENIPVYGTFLNGDNIYQQELSANGLIVMGNEGNGISLTVEQLITRRLYIPNYPPGKESSESLNVAIATAVVCAEFRRRLNC